MRFYDSMGFESKHGIWVRVLGQVTDDDGEEMGYIEFSFEIKGVCYFINFRKTDLRNILKQP